MAKSVKLPKPLPNFILLEIPPRKKDVSGFAIVKDKKDDRTKAQEGKVLAIGVNKWGFVFRADHDEVGVKPFFKVGDTVFYSSFTGHEVSNKLILIEYKNILAVK